VNLQRLETDLREFLRRAYPTIEVRVGNCYIRNLLPADYCATLEVSRLKAEYWRARAAQIEPYDPHAGPRE